MPHRKFHQPFHRVAQWLSQVHDEPHQGRMTFKKMVPCRSKSQTQPPGADDLPPSYSADAQQTNYRLNFVWVCSVVKSGQLPQLTPDGSLSTDWLLVHPVHSPVQHWTHYHQAQEELCCEAVSLSWEVKQVTLRLWMAIAPTSSFRSVSIASESAFQEPLLLFISKRHVELFS